MFDSLSLYSASSTPFRIIYNNNDIDNNGKPVPEWQSFSIDTANHVSTLWGGGKWCRMHDQRICISCIRLRRQQMRERLSAVVPTRRPRHGTAPSQWIKREKNAGRIFYWNKQNERFDVCCQRSRRIDNGLNVGVWTIQMKCCYLMQQNRERKETTIDLKTTLSKQWQ